MRNGQRSFALAMLLLVPLPVLRAQEDDGNKPEAATIVQKAFDYWRDKASVATVEMTIHRPDWERTQVFRSWTKGEDLSFIVVTEPARDRGNGTLKRGQEMWTFNPKISRVIKLPPSMMAQSWMGSDFSNNDLAKSDSILHDYTHEQVGREHIDGVLVYTIESVPKPGAPVIWGKQRLKIREDWIFLEQAFYDEAGEVVKVMTTGDLRMTDGKLYPREMLMRPADKDQEYTRLYYSEIDFRDSLPDSLFTRSALRNPPQ